MKPVVHLLVALLTLQPLSGFAGDPAELAFERAAPTVAIVQVFNEAARLVAQGSGVVVGPTKVITNCHVVKRTHKATLRVAVNGTKHVALLDFALGEYDLCLLEVEDLNGNSPPIQSLDRLRVGQRVYAIGAPSGLELTLTDGLISGIRSAKGITLIQTSAPISPGSSGGGLFSAEGELIGITTFGLKQSSALNFAYSADSIPVMLALTAAVQHGIDDTSRLYLRERAENRKQWLSEKSQRLADRFQDLHMRLDFLMVVDFEAVRAGLDPGLVLALIDVVSGFEKNAISKTGARGYMQVGTQWPEMIGSRDHNLFHARTNLRYGVTILRHFLNTTKGDYYDALIKYMEQIGVASPAAREQMVIQIVTAWKQHWR